MLSQEAVRAVEQLLWTTPEERVYALLDGASVSGLLDRLFDGRVAPLVAHFSEHRKLSRKDIAELRKLLEELDDGER